MGRRQMKGGPGDLDEMNVSGNDDAAVYGDGVAIRTVDGVAMFWPVSFDRLSPEARDAAEEVMHCVGQRRALSARIDATAPELRELGLSWGQIGWLVGMSDEGVRQRWGVQ